MIILADDHGYGDVSMHGGPNIRTPNVDRIAAGGIRFTRFYANSSVCSPSRASLMTGRFPDRVGVPGVIRTDGGNNWGYFRQDAITLPQVLARGGYFSTLVGKWHLGLEEENHPCRRGFDRFRGFLGDMMDDYCTHRRHGQNYMRDGENEIDPPGHATDLFTQWAVEEIQERAREDRPFFLYLAYNAPHTPIQPPQEWLDRVRRREPQVGEQRARYIALVEHLDDGVGKVLDALEASGQADNTLVIYTSDNGGQINVGACNGPLRGQKGDMYEGGIRIPACACWPGHIPPDTVSDRPAMLMDLFPSICEAASVPVEHQIEGISILPTLRGQHQDLSARILYWLRREGHHPFFGLCQHAVRQGDWKLLHNTPFSRLELFNLAADELEKTDLSACEKQTRDRLALLLQQESQKAGAVPWQK